MVEDAAFLDLPGRIAKCLLQLADRHGIKGEKSIEVIISQSDLAEFIGVTRQIINSHLQVWRANGWIELSRGKVFVVNKDALSGLAAIHD